MVKNIKSLQLLRNGQLFTSYAAAVAGITGTPTDDGVIKLARYTYTQHEEGSGDTKYVTATAKTIFGICHNPKNVTEGTTGYTYTIFDSYHEVIQNIQNQIDSLTGGTGSIAQQIEAALDKLDFSGVTGNVVTGVEQTNGKVTATGANVGTLALTGYEEGTASGHVEATDSINDAFAKLQNQIDAANDAKDAAIADLDYTDTAVAGEYVSQVTETDGKIAVTRVELPSLAEVHEDGKPIIAVSEDKGQVAASAGTINAQFVNVTGDTFSSTTVQGALEEIDAEYKAADAALKNEILGSASASADTLGELETLINNLKAGAATYTVRKDTENLPATIKERYTLVETVNGVNTDKQVSIDVPKDSHIVSIDYIDDPQDAHYQNLEYVYINDSGATSTTYVDMANLILETEFGSGITVTDHVAHGVVDPTSETFLTVGANGFKLSGVQVAINAASGDVKSKLDELSGKTEALSAKTVTSIASADGSVTATPGQAADGTVSYDLSTDASKVKVSSAYTAGTNTAIATGDTVDTALAKLEAQIAAAKAAATVVEKDANASHLTLTSTTGTSGEIIYTIGESDIASASALTAEIAARKAVDGQNGDTYAANTSANYISAATSLNDADVKLDTALKAVADSATSAQTEIDAIETAVGLNADGTYRPDDGTNYVSEATSVSNAMHILDEQVRTNEIAIEGLQDSYISGITMNGSGVTVTDNVAALTATYTNTAANSENGMVITTGNNGGLTFQFGTLDCGEYN